MHMHVLNVKELKKSGPAKIYSRVRVECGSRDPHGPGTRGESLHNSALEGGTCFGFYIANFHLNNYGAYFANHFIVNNTSIILCVIFILGNYISFFQIFICYSSLLFWILN